MVRLTIEIDEAAYEALRREAEAGDVAVERVAAARLDRLARDAATAADSGGLTVADILEFAREHARVPGGSPGWSRRELYDALDREDDDRCRRRDAEGRPG